MKTAKLILNLFLMIGILATFSACNGQTNAETSEKLVQEKSVGQHAESIQGGAMVIFQDSKGNHWFGGDGVYKYDGVSLTHYSTKDGLCGNGVLGIQEDQLGNLYFDTTEGVSTFDGQTFSTLEIVEIESNRNEWKMEPNDLWFRIGWNHPGPFRWDGEQLYELEFPETREGNQFYKDFPGTSFTPYGLYSLYTDSKGVVWFGTSSVGVFRYDGTQLSYLYEDHLTNTPSGGSMGMRSTFEDSKGNYWFTNTHYSYSISPGIADLHEHGTMNYTRNEGPGFLNEDNEIEYPYFMSITEDAHGDLWMATYDHGVWRNTGEELVHYSIQQNNKSVTLFTTYTDQQGVVWLASHDAGAWKYNGTEFEKFEP